VKRASVTEAKNGLSALIDRVRHGESILIEDRGTPVAQLTPVSRVPSGSDRDRVTRLERQGVLRPAMSAGPSTVLAVPPPRPARPVSLSRLVQDERQAGW